MRQSLALFLFLAGLPAFSAVLEAQTAPPPIISSIPSRRASDPERITVLGANLGIVTEVRLDGVSFPITRNTGNRLVFGPVPPQSPGFGQVELVFGRGTVEGVLALTPTLSAIRHGQHVEATLENGEAGTFVLAGSFRSLPAPVQEPGIYFGRLLPLTAVPLAAGLFADDQPITVRAKIPIELGLIGAPFHLQSRNSMSADGFRSYSNPASVPGLGQHQ